jgi:seryl-tRNA synthetase
MIDRAILRDNPDLIRRSLSRRHSDFDLDELIGWDGERRRMLALVESLRAEQGVLSKRIGAAMQAGEGGEGLKEQVRSIAAEIGEETERLSEAESRFDESMANLPNLLHDAVPEGESEADNVELSHWGFPRTFNFIPRPHWEIGEHLGIIDSERSAKLSQARFTMTMGYGAAMERSLISLMLDIHTRNHGYTEVAPPFLANEKCLFGTGQLPKFEEDLFKTREGLYLIPTAEVPLTNIHAGEILEKSHFPISYTAYTPCFRGEAGAAGRESRGLIRVHQFHKVELMKLVLPGSGDEELEKLTRDAESVLEILGLPFRRIALCGGDVGFGASQTFDLEVWMPGMSKWVEISSCSQYGDFQARRAGIRFRPIPGAKPELVHTMNGSGLAVGRTLAAILENYQEADGTVIVPEALRAYLGGKEKIS